jgi:pyruvate dehydrogenase E1 component alpha subunit
MHMADFKLGIIGANGIVGAGMPIALGAALSARLRRSRQVAVAFFGEGASNEGTFHESLNLAATWSLPLVFVCENNGYGQLTRMELVTARLEIVVRADAYGIPGIRVDGNDCVAVFAAAADAVRRAREGEGPTLIEALTYRWREHAEGLELMFPGLRPEGELASWRARDPLARHRTMLLERGIEEMVVRQIEQRVEAELAAAVEFARSATDPEPAAAFEDMFAHPLALPIGSRT